MRKKSVLSSGPDTPIPENEIVQKGGGRYEFEPLWFRCDVCGRFISLNDFDKGAVHRLIYPDSEFTVETYETLCLKHIDK